MLFCIPNGSYCVNLCTATTLNFELKISTNNSFFFGNNYDRL